MRRVLRQLGLAIRGRHPRLRHDCSKPVIESTRIIQCHYSPTRWSDPFYLGSTLKPRMS